MKNRILLRSLMTACAVGLASPAYAQFEPMPEPMEPTTEPGMETPFGGPELTSIMQAPNTFQVRVPLAINLSSDFVGKPVSIPVDAYFGLSEQLTLGLTHSGGVVQAVSPYFPGTGLCLSGSDDCGKTYDNVGFDALFSMMSGVLQLAAHGGLEIESIDQGTLSLRLGVLFQAPLGENIALITDPRLFLGLTDREDTAGGNKEYLDLPIAVQVWATPGARIAARTGINGPLDGFGDAFRGALGVFGGFAVNEMIEIFASFDFFNIYGKNNSADFRFLTVGVNIQP